LEPEDLKGLTPSSIGGASNDPIGNLNEAWTEEINFSRISPLGPIRQSSRRRAFLFSSSCIMYGMSEAAV